jgi:ABC-type nitrate/sulfonate/bicarbonate transport system substrate-binding protein
VRQFGRPYDAVGRQFSIASWYAMSKWSTEGPQAARAFEQAVGEASRYANTHGPQIIPVMAQFAGVDVATLEAAARAPFTDRADPADFQAIIDLEVKYKVIDHGFEAKDFISPNAMRR